jgi:hypothetical protein
MMLGAALALGAARTAQAAPAADKTAAKATPKKAPGKKAKSAKKKPEPAPAAEATGKRRHLGVSPAYIVGDQDTSAHYINQAAPPIQPFGENSKVVQKAFAETRRDQLVDAEKAARAEKTPDRWRTVLFMLHGLPEHDDSETCFWRVLSFYRLGELERARKVRENCELPAKDSSALNTEDARAAGTPTMDDLRRAALAQQAQPGQAPVQPDAGANTPSPTSAYSGPSPQRRD